MHVKSTGVANENNNSNVQVNCNVHSAIPLFHHSAIAEVLQQDSLATSFVQG